MTKTVRKSDADHRRATKAAAKKGAAKKGAAKKDPGSKGATKKHAVKKGAVKKSAPKKAPAVVTVETGGSTQDRSAAEVRTPRTADQIGRTEIGPRAVPALAVAREHRRQTLVRRELDNGLTVIVARKPGTPLVEFRLRVPFGGSTAAHAARAEMLAATLLLGTGSRSREQVDAELAAVGGHLDTGVDPQRFLVSGSVLAHGVPTLMTVLADCLTDPAFRRHDVLGERERLVEHLAIAASQPAAVARMHLQQQRFGQHPASREMPDAQAVAAVGEAALRSLFKRALVPAGSTLVLVGDLSPARVLAVVERALARWTSSATAVSLQTPPAVVGGPLRAFHRDGAVQSQVRLTAAAVDRTDPDYPAAQLANLIYGGYFSSRLVENIREDKGYTYHAHSGMEFWPGRAATTVSFDTNTDSSVAALLEARYELGRIALTPPAESEVEAARNYALGTLATSLSTQAGYASTLSSLAGHGLGAQWLQTHRSRLAKVGAAEVAKAASRLLAPAAFTGVVVGDLAVIGDRLAALGDVELP